MKTDQVGICLFLLTTETKSSAGRCSMCMYLYTAGKEGKEANDNKFDKP